MCGKDEKKKELYEGGTVKDEKKKELYEGGTVKEEDGLKRSEEETKPSSDIQVNADSVQQAKMEDDKGK